MASWNTHHLSTLSNAPMSTHNARRRSPSVGRHTAVSQSQSLDWMRRTLQPMEPPGRVPEVFLDVERTARDGKFGSSLAGRRRSLSPAARHGVVGAAVIPGGNHSSPALVSEAMVLRARSPLAGSSSIGGSNNTQTARTWITTQHLNRSGDSSRATSATRVGGVGGGLSPHRTSHQHCAHVASLRTSALARSVSPARLASVALNSSQGEHRHFTPRIASASRVNAPRWSDAQLTAIRNSHRFHGATSAGELMTSGIIDPDFARRDVQYKFALETFRSGQRSAHSSLPVCQTIGTDNSGCSCVDAAGNNTIAGGGADDRGRLLVHSIDTLLRANRNDGEMSPARAELVRSNSSPVAARVESIVKREVQRRLQRERDAAAEKQRLRDEAAAAKQSEMEHRHSAALLKAQGEADTQSARAMVEAAARLRADAERTATQERMAREKAEAEAAALRQRIEDIDVRAVSPGAIRVAGGWHSAGNASRVATAAANSVGNMSNNIGSADPAHFAGRNLQQPPEDEGDQFFAGFNSVRRNADATNRNVGTFDPVSAKAIQRASGMRSNLLGTSGAGGGGTTPGAAGGTPLSATNFHPHSPGVASSIGSNRGDVASIVSQLASAGSSPLGDLGSEGGGASGTRRMGSASPGGPVLTPRGGGGVPGTSTAGLFGGGGGGGGVSTSPSSYYAQQVIPAPSFVPRLGAAGGGGMLAPTVGMKERDAQIQELMRRTHDKHAMSSVRQSPLAGQPSSYDSKYASPARTATGLMSSQHQQQQQGAGSGQQRHPQVFVPVSAIEQRLFAEEDAAMRFQQHHLIAGAGESVPRGSLSPISHSSGASPQSPPRVTGPAYAPSTLVEPPMAAGPSGLWVQRVQR